MEYKEEKMEVRETEGERKEAVKGMQKRRKIRIGKGKDKFEEEDKYGEI
jgi:hypothetical protein